jgi:hypothetical protein
MLVRQASRGRRPLAVEIDGFTALSARHALSEVAAALQDDEWLAQCFVD